MRRPWILLMLISSAAWTGCAHTMDMPEGFVPVEDLESGAWTVRGISADGVVVALRVREVPKEGTLEFWCTAVTSELVDSRGYKADKPEDVTSSSGVEGRLLAFTTEQEGVPFTYVVALFPAGRTLLLAEAGGKTETYNTRKDAIRKALLSTR